MAGMRWSRFLGLTSVIGLSALLGACGPSKTELAALEETRMLREKQGELDTRLAGIEGNVSSLQSQVAAAQVRPATPEPTYTGGGGGGGGGNAARSERRVDLGGNLFNAGSDQLTSAGKKALDSAVRNISKGSSITVEGFSDASPIRKSKWPSNEALSEARARSVATYLRGKGYSIADTVGYGAVTRDGRAPSRRVELVVAE
jgi:outer membrane protein OmpA-like peptidoglycan-associated protein